MSSLLSGQVLKEMRAAQELAMPDTAAIVRYTTSSDSKGGTTPTLVTDAGTTICRVSSGGAPSEYLQDERAAGRQLWMITMPYDANVLATDKLTIGSVTYGIIGFASGGAWMTAKRAVCVEAK